MREYVKPFIENEEIELEDIIAASGYDINTADSTDSDWLKEE